MDAQHVTATVSIGDFSADSLDSTLRLIYENLADFEYMDQDICDPEREEIS